MHREDIGREEGALRVSLAPVEIDDKPQQRAVLSVTPSAPRTSLPDMRCSGPPRRAIGVTAARPRDLMGLGGRPTGCTR
ncbi:hypothetical protein Sviol_49570 [Streptomyces violascens]|uniref:Uncharacterized protein n=1 Tax=Streptomyces violascens TaxID=67381 RepID=A0ABQ3QTK7_9ACTN|nr:hypothetical protein Sviol_49570 [Streptomyces violascens]